MAGYFQLINLATGEADTFNSIDEQLCAAFDTPVNPDEYLIGWYNAIGGRVAMGKSLSEVREIFLSYIEEAKIDIRKQNQIEYYNNLILLLDWISERYTTNSWYSVGK